MTEMHISNMLPFTSEKKASRGLPQGLPTSPLLTVASLETNFIGKSPWPMIMYADDGIIYGNGTPPDKDTIIRKLSNDKYGITINESKSGYVKVPGKELNIKFLGIRMEGDTLKASTREGATLEYNKSDLVDIMDFLEEYECSLHSRLTDSTTLEDTIDEYVKKRKTKDT